jgi:hypothetical protein
MILFFICRICMILHPFSIAINLNAFQELNCGLAVWFSKVGDALGTCTASMILCLRTHAVWGQDKRVGIPLAALSLGQMAVWSQTFRYSISKWNVQRNMCMVVKTAPQPLLVTVFAYTMAFDLIILILCTYRLHTSSKSGGIATLLMRDGIAYFTAVFAANLLQMIFAALALNQVMNIMNLPFAAVVSTVAATTVFRNVFSMHGGLAVDSSLPRYASNGPSGGNVSGRPGQGSSRRLSGLRFNGGAESYALESRVDASPVEVRKVIEVDVQSSPYEDKKSPGW